MARLYTPDPSMVRPPESARRLAWLEQAHEQSKKEVEAARRQYMRCKIDLENLEDIQTYHRDLSRRLVDARNAYPDQGAA